MIMRRFNIRLALPAAVGLALGGCFAQENSNEPPRSAGLPAATSLDGRGPINNSNPQTAGAGPGVGVPQTGLGGENSTRSGTASPK